jgi:hypothetical protein
MRFSAERMLGAKAEPGKGFCAALLLIAALALLSAPSATAQSGRSVSGMVRRVGGATEEMELRAIDEAGVMRFANQELAAERIWRFGRDTAKLRGAYVMLKDGSRLAATLLATDGNELVFRGDEFHPGIWDGLRVPLSEVRAVLWKPPHGKAALTAVARFSLPTETDVLRLDNGDQVRGEFRAIVINDAAQSEEVVFAISGAESRIAVGRVVSLQFAEPKEPPKVDLRDAWTFAFAEGSRMRMRKPVIGEAGAVWQAASGGKRTIAANVFWKQVLCIEPPRADVVFLSDMAAQGYRHLPVFGEPVEWRRDRSVIGEPLRHAGGYFEKGIGMPSNARLSFAIPQGARRFEAEICLDDAAGESAANQGSAVFRVLTQVAGGPQSEIKDLFRSDVIRGGEASKVVSVDVSGATSLILLVEAADQGEVLDLANWIDARFVISSRAP